MAVSFKGRQRSVGFILSLRSSSREGMQPEVLSISCWLKGVESFPWVVAGDRNTHGETDGLELSDSNLLGLVLHHCLLFCPLPSLLKLSLTNESSAPQPLPVFTLPLIWSDLPPTRLTAERDLLPSPLLPSLTRSPTCFLWGYGSFLYLVHTWQHTLAALFLISPFTFQKTSILKQVCLCNWIKRGYIWLQTLK